MQLFYIMHRKFPAFFMQFSVLFSIDKIDGKIFILSVKKYADTGLFFFESPQNLYTKSFADLDIFLET